jgi:hypothetical protein
MKKKHSEPIEDDLRPHYDLDYAATKPNRFSGVQKSFKKTYVTLDEDVSAVFQSSDEVNTLLRVAIRTMEQAGKKQTKTSSAKRRAS